jgi:3-isopropylmalate dehydrogenase
LWRIPGQFDVILTENTFGDILSDEASMITGSIGMLSSASLNETKTRTLRAEPRFRAGHCGQNIANPLATILSAAMLLRYSLDLDSEADAIENAVKMILDEGIRTPISSRKDAGRSPRPKS